jgi:ribonuclease VapC
MIVDTSAIVAILRREPDAKLFADALESSPANRMSTAGYVEAGVVADRDRDPVMSRQLDVLLRQAEIKLVAFDETHARIAREAYRDFGKGSGHAARLNFGDCFAYALAKAMHEPLLFKGRDFRHTDVTPALE